MVQTTYISERFRNRLAMLIGSTYVIWFFSEMFFFNEGEGFYAYSSLSGLSDILIYLADLLINVLLFYGLFTLWLLMPIYLFCVRSIWALFLAGALCGWAIEGIFPIMYAEMPVAILWPAGSWHIIIDVILGWFLLRKLLEHNNHRLTLIVFGALGLFWGFWGTWFWPLEGTGTPEEFIVPLTIPEFAFFTFSSTLLLVIGYYLLDRFGGTSYNPTEWEIGAWIGLSTLGLVFLAQFNALIFAILVGGVMLILMRNKHYETQEPIFSTFNPGVKITNLFLIFMMPAVANLAYFFCLSNHISVNKWVGIILSPIILVSISMFILSTVIILGMKKKLRKQGIE